MIAAVFVLAFALRFRSHTAYKAALALDTAGAVIAFVAAAVLVRDARLVLLGFPLLFAGGLAWLTWRNREAFAKVQRL